MARVAGLDVPGIVRAALAIADRDGIDRLTMRRLSIELGVTPMATYYHVSGKDGLLDLVIDESIGQLPVVDPETDDGKAVVEWFLRLHKLLVDHPALAAAAAGRRIEGPHAARAAIALTRLGGRICGSDDRAGELVIAAFWLTLGSGQHRASRHAVDLDRSLRTEPASPDDEVALQARILAKSVDSELFSRSLTTLVTAYLG